MPWPTGCRCRPVIHNFLCVCVCMCVPPPLACQQDMALSEIRDLPSLPSLLFCTLPPLCKRSECSIWKAKLKEHYHSMRHSLLASLLPPSLLERGSKPPAFRFQVCFCNPPLRLLPLYAPPPPSACAIAQFLWHRVSSPYLRQRRRRRRLQLCKLPAR